MICREKWALCGATKIPFFLCCIFGHTVHATSLTWPVLSPGSADSSSANFSCSADYFTKAESHLPRVGHWLKLPYFWALHILSCPQNHCLHCTISYSHLSSYKCPWLCRSRALFLLAAFLPETAIHFASTLQLGEFLLLLILAFPSRLLLISEKMIMPLFMTWSKHSPDHTLETQFQTCFQGFHCFSFFWRKRKKKCFLIHYLDRNGESLPLQQWWYGES